MLAARYKVNRIQQGKKLNRIHIFPSIEVSPPKPIESMIVTADTIQRIQAARKELGLNQSEMADLLGLHRTTISKLLKGEIATMRPEIVEAFLDKMNLDLQPLRTPQGSVSPAAARLSEFSKSNADLAATLEFLARLCTPQVKPLLPDVDTDKLPKIGAALTRIVHRWENATDPHYAKIAAEALDWIREFYRKGAK